MRLRTKTLLYISCLIIVLVSLTTGVFINRFNSDLNEFLKIRGTEFARLLADDVTVPILVNDIAAIRGLVSKRIKKPDIISIGISDIEGNIVFQDENDSLTGVDYKTFNAPIMWYEGSGNLQDNENLLFHDNTVTYDEGLRQNNVKEIGTVSIGYSIKSIQQKREKIIKNTILLAIVLVIVSLSITFFLVQKLLLHPIELIALASGKITGGDYSERVNIDSRNDEIGTMVGAFNTMAGVLQDYTESLERKVEERTLELKQVYGELENKAFYAGMAEIARGVLHDVNNAMQGLHSNFSTLDLSIEDIDIESLEEILVYMKGLKQSNEKWNDVLSFFDEANKLFLKKKTEAMNSLQECGKIISHITEIISAQQKHAKSGTIKEVLDVNAVLLNSINIFRQSLEKRNIKLVHKTVENLPRLYLNTGELERFFGNFIKNAIDSMDEMPNKLHELFIETVLTHNKIHITFKDSGKGIKESDIPNIFRSDFTTKESGTGFGLSYCLDFMKRNDGEIHVNSIENKGTEFLLIFSTYKNSA